jgi:nucleoid-associated protein YgaU
LPSPAAGVTPATAEIKRPPEIRKVVAKRGDTLTKIIIQNYGDFSQDKLKDILKENPEIRNPNWIMEGQALNLPGLK